MANEQKRHCKNGIGKTAYRVKRKVIVVPGKKNIASVPRLE